MTFSLECIVHIRGVAWGGTLELQSQATRLEGKVATVNRQPYGPITLYGQWPQSSWTLTCQSDREETLPNATFREAKMTCSSAMAYSRFIRHY